MPTWIARLDARHMAFLKDHKVENHVIFPAAAFVEMALEAGVQLFEGRPFVVEDFEIRKPLILPDPPSGVQLELSYDRRTSARLRSRAASNKASPGRSTSSARCAANGRNRPSLRPNGSDRTIARIGRGRRLLSAHERPRVALRRGISSYSRTVRRRRQIRGPGDLVRGDRARAPASMRCTRCFSTARCRSFPPARRPSKVGRRG